jgi:glutathione S-transferase
MPRLTLYFSPGACSLAPHIALEEAGLPFELAQVTLAKGEQNAPEYRAINPKGRVPALVEDGWTLTECPAILRHVARHAPGLWPDDPRLDARCAEWLAWCSSTVHPTYAHVRRPERYADDEAARAAIVAKGREACSAIWAEIDARLGRGPWALGDAYSVADAYLMPFWHWGRSPFLAYEMAADYPNWTAHARRMAERPAVRRVFEREGLELP